MEGMTGERRDSERKEGDRERRWGEGERTD
jgi:hypothetical protein